MERLSKDATLRKNGRLTSCEPCRISKIRCDHRRPTCNRCEMRRLSSKCYYHPAPMTKSSKNSTRKSARFSVPPNRGDKDAQQHPIVQVCSQLPPSRHAEVNIESTARSTYLGSTSFLSVFRETQPGLSLNPLPHQVLRGRWSCDNAFVASRLVQLLSSLGLCEELLLSHYERCQFTVIPLQLVMQPLEMTQSFLETASWTKDLRPEEIYSRITQNTARSFPKLNATISPRDFFALFTGANLRWEFVAIILCMAGLGALASKGHQVRLYRIMDEEPITADVFAEEMIAASSACMEICKQYDNVNDLMIWLCITHFALASDIFGETSHRIYTLLGDMISYIHAMGLHRFQSSDADIPFFISETRKRLFAATYRADKNVATLFGRPPRLPHRYCDASLPLDIDDVSINHQDCPEQLLRQVGPDGWNTTGASGGTFRQAALLRLRYMISVLREQVLELSLGRKTPSFAKELRTTYQECMQMWAQIPKQYHYSASCWELLSPSTCLAMVLIHFEYLYTVFQVERIRCRENLDDTKDLLDTSMRIISVVNDIMKQRDQAGSVLRSHFLWIFLFNALPTAGALATEVHRCTVAEIPLPCSATRSEIIRKLSVFVSWFGSADPSISYTHRICVEVNKSITTLLDETLNYQPKSGSRPSEGQRLDLNRSRRPVEEGSCEPAITWKHGEEQLPESANFGTSTDFLSWLDDLGFETNLPEFLL